MCTFCYRPSVSFLSSTIFRPFFFSFQYVAPQRVYATTSMEDEKVATLGLPDQLPSPQGLFQSTPSPLFSISQVRFHFVIVDQIYKIYSLLKPFLLLMLWPAAVSITSQHWKSCCYQSKIKRIWYALSISEVCD